MILLRPITFFLIACCTFYQGYSQTLNLDGETVTLDYFKVKDIPHLPIQRTMIYRPTVKWTYSHHASITHFKDLFVATWSNGYWDEDDPSQRVLFSTSKDFFHWTEPKILALPNISKENIFNILTAGGFHQFGDTLVAYYGEYDLSRKYNRLWAKTSGDGIHWSDPINMEMPVTPNLGPIKVKSGRLIIRGNYTLPFTDDTTGLKGWKMSSFYSNDSAMILGDNPWIYEDVCAKMGLPPLCEVDFFQTDNQVIHSLFRDRIGTVLFQSESKDNGEHWSRPVMTAFPNPDTKFNFGKLPDGRFYYVGNPDIVKGGERNPLVLSISTDGIKFNDTYIIADEIYPRKKEGKYKHGQYGYPTSIIYKDSMYIIVSREKEAVEVIRFKLKDL